MEEEIREEMPVLEVGRLCGSGRIGSILGAGWRIGKKVALAGAVITSAPVVLPPLAIFSVLGFAFSVPVGLVFAGYVCNEKVMRYLLSEPRMSEEEVEPMDDQGRAEGVEEGEILEVFEGGYKDADPSAGLEDTGVGLAIDFFRKLPDLVQSFDDEMARDKEMEITRDEERKMQRQESSENKREESESENHESKTMEEDVIITEEEKLEEPTHEKNAEETTRDEAPALPLGNSELPVASPSAANSDTEGKDGHLHEREIEEKTGPVNAEDKRSNDEDLAGEVNDREISEKDSAGTSPLSAGVTEGDEELRDQKMETEEKNNEDGKENTQENQWLPGVIRENVASPMKNDESKDDNGEHEAKRQREDAVVETQEPKREKEGGEHASSDNDIENGGSQRVVDEMEEEAGLTEVGGGIMANYVVAASPTKGDDVQEGNEAIDQYEVGQNTERAREEKFGEEDERNIIEEEDLVKTEGMDDVKDEKLGLKENNIGKTDVREVGEGENDTVYKEETTKMDGVEVAEIDGTAERAMIHDGEDYDSSEGKEVSPGEAGLVLHDASTDKEHSVEENNGNPDDSVLESSVPTEKVFIGDGEKKDGEPSEGSAETPELKIDGEEKKRSDATGNGISSSRPSASTSETETSQPSDDEDVYSEEMVWEQINALRTIVGYKADLHDSFMEELKALYIFTGVDPPVSADASSNLAQATDELQFLKSVIGVR